MYKRASRNMQHALRVDSIDPAKGFIGGEVAGDPLDSPAAMTDAALEAERRSLAHENQRWIHEQQAASAAKDDRRRRAIGHTLQSLQARIAEINAEIKKRNIARSERENLELKRLLREELGDARYIELAEIARENARSAQQ